jgi:N-methylhydantoinase A
MGQSFELTIAVPEGRVTKKSLAKLEEAFGVEHERTYGHRAGPGEPVEIVSLQVIGQGIPDKARVPGAIRVERSPTRNGMKRKAYFGPKAGWIEVPVYGRADLKTKKKGACIIEEYDATCVVPIGATANLDRFGNIVINLK